MYKFDTSVSTLMKIDRNLLEHSRMQFTKDQLEAIEEFEDVTDVSEYSSADNIEQMSVFLARIFRKYFRNHL